MSKSDDKKRKLYLKLVALIFLMILATYLILMFVFMLFESLDYVNVTSPFRMGPITLVVIFMIGSLILGLILAFFASKMFLRSINTLSDGMKKVSKGDFSVKIENKDEDSEMGELIANFNKMVKDLGQVEMLKKDFISNVSHEFKTPLATIQGYSVLLQDKNLSQEERDSYVKYIVNATKQLSELTSNILKLSKLENSSGNIVKTRFDVSEQIRQAILFLETQWSIKNLDLDIDLAYAEMLADADLLMQVWLNIIGNAIKFSDYAGKIIIKGEQSSGYYTVTVTDYGCGMNESTLKRVFEKFYQGDNSHSKEGNGLGLALVKKILDVSGGSIKAESKEGYGSTFTISVPVAKANAVQAR